MAVYIVLDIETIPHPSCAHWLEPVQPDARLKDPEKIAASILERTAEQLAECSFDPDLYRICALGYHVVGQPDPHCFLMRDEFEERHGLHQWWEEYRALDRRNEVRLVTFNGLKFDIPGTLRRAMYLDVHAPDLDLDRYRSPHANYDIWWRLTYKGLIKAHGLKFYAKRFGFTTLDRVNGGDIAQLVKDEDWAAVEAHCLSDIGLTHAIANRLGILKV
jgi:hypothetical protein